MISLTVFGGSRPWPSLARQMRLLFHLGVYICWAENSKCHVNFEAQTVASQEKVDRNNYDYKRIPRPNEGKSG
ncbi:hypothetical protein CRYUN_Cryun09bG0084800 [Craigia yunnanensis]